MKGGKTRKMAQFKNLIVWQKADEMAFQIYRLTETFPKTELFGLCTQLRRAALSVPSNIVEGNNRKSKKEFHHFIDIALGSLAETEYLLMFAIRLGYTSGEISNVEKLISDVGQLLWRLQKSL